MKDILFIIKELGLYDGLFYFIYKIYFKINKIRFINNSINNRKRRIEKIYDCISMFTNGVNIQKEKKYILMEIPYCKRKVFLRPFSSDTMVFNQVFQLQEYKSVVQIYNQFFKNTPQEIFDCGANIGLTTAYFNMFYPDAFYTIIEPFEENIISIKLNLDSIKLNKYIIVEGGVWNEDTKLSINRSFGDGKEWAISLSKSKNNENIIPVYSLSNLIEKKHKTIDILKIDIEGAENILFEEFSYASRFLSNVKCIAIEIHDQDEARNKIYKYLEGNNFFYFNSGELTIGINKNFI
jgi:FkbM family methyltransferase